MTSGACQDVALSLVRVEGGELSAGEVADL